MFGFPAVVHSDNAKCFVSREIKQFLTERGVLSTFTSVYNPRGNSQCERYNGVIWNAVRLALRTKGMEISRWESVLPQVLHSLRSLLCTATNETPHERRFLVAKVNSSSRKRIGIEDMPEIKASRIASLR